MSVRNRPAALTVAGSDSGGGAGIQADLKTFAAHGVYGTSAITALTAQNTTGVQAVYPVSPDFVVAQIRSVLEDIGADAIKTGMLANEVIIEAVARELEGQTLVVDPVMVSKSGHRLLEEAAIDALRFRLMPIATIVTPNLAEAEALVDFAVRNKEGMLAAAQAIKAFGPKWVLVKGGHLEGAPDDLLWDGERAIWLEGERLDSAFTHGTGCALSAAIAANLALGAEMIEACKRAKSFLTAAIKAGFKVGSGVNPPNWFYGMGH